jgi:hypothetical protein
MRGGVTCRARMQRREERGSEEVASGLVSSALGVEAEGSSAFDPWLAMESGE